MDLRRVLLVEDNESDEQQAVRSIGRAGLNLEVVVAHDGEEASDLLHGPVSYSLVLLDLKLPKVNGFQVLKQIRREAQTRYLPVVILTSSGEPKDAQSAFDLGANSYIQKQMDPDLSDSSLKLALYYWLAVDAVANPFIRMSLDRDRRESATSGKRDLIAGKEK